MLVYFDLRSLVFLCSWWLMLESVSSQVENLGRFSCSFSIIHLSFVIAGAAPFHNDNCGVPQ
jgi:hypothetical protein